MDFLKSKRTQSNINAIAEQLTEYVNNNTISEEELTKILGLVRDEVRLQQLIPLL